ncbi:hypothetical protein BDR07DRAFT_1389440 [Suillus spraguei]|nr:hypothetical protein BDR07DRAFT_1389440 [Suillus spraguei]
MALQSRSVPMNASPHHSKVKVSLALSDPIFVAGNNISGKMEVECRGDGECGLGIGLIMVELFAAQEITSRDHSGTSTFIHSRRLFQGPGLPPSNAIQSDFDPPPGEFSLPAHHYPARRASVGVALRGEKRLVTDHQDINVVEYCDIRAPSKRPQGFAVAEDGNVWAQAFVTNVACVELQLKNNSLNWTSGVTLTLSRELRLSSPSVDKDAFTITDTESRVYGSPGIEGIANLVINIPRSSRGSRGDARVGENGKTTDCLFEVCCSLKLRIDMPIGSKPIIIIIPLVIHHPLAVPKAHASPYAIPATSPQPYASPPTHAYPLSPPPGASYIDPHFSPQQYDPLHTYWSPPSPIADYKPFTPAFWEQHYPQDLSSSNPHFQHYIPLSPRPASAEPRPQMPYYDTSLPSGLPTSTTHLLLPHPPISYCPPQAVGSSSRYLADSEEGKGTRASRISETLRLSSRHRSVSPLSHRFPLPQPSAQHVSPGRQHPGAIQIPTLPNPHDFQGVLHSPRPIPSPKQSYSGPSPRSENVCALERMADEVGRHNGDLSADLPKCAAGVDSNVNKTLPSPLITSSKQPLHVRQHVQAVFPDTAVPNRSVPKPKLEPAFPPPPTPPLAAITPVKFPRAQTELSGLSTKYTKGAPQESGLDALERRLLAEVGSRRQDIGELHPDVRSVVQPIKIPASGTPADANDSAISSLTLADRDAFLRGDEDEREQEQEQDHDSDERTQHRGGRHSQSDDEREVRTQRGRGRAKSKYSDEDDERRVTQKRERKRGKEGDVRKLRSEVKGRIAAWLGEIDTSPPLVDDSLSTMSPVASHFVPITDREPFAPPPSSEELLPSSGDQELGGTSFNDGVSAAPNPRSSGFVTISTLKAAGTRHSTVPAPENIPSISDAEKKTLAGKPLVPGPILRRMSAGQSTIATPVGSLPSAPLARPKSPDVARADPVTRHFLSPHQPRHSPQPLGPGVKYDVRSARGGKGGRVTEVASLWAAKADATHAKQNGASQPVKKPVNHGGKLPVKSPLSTSQTHGPSDASREGRGKTTKATTVPAIISSSHAVPMLSSTASLARASPNPQNPASRPLPPMISETMSDLRTVKTPIPRVTRAPGNLGFGQARLRDLIKKYQG